jgi:hypothetical protein
LNPFGSTLLQIVDFGTAWGAALFRRAANWDFRFFEHRTENPLGGSANVRPAREVAPKSNIYFYSVSQPRCRETEVVNMDQQDFIRHDGIFVPAAALQQERQRTKYGKFEVLSENPMRERIIASPAVADGRLLLRGDEHLFCIEMGKR